MKVEQRIWQKDRGWESISMADKMDSAHLVFVFGATHLLKEAALLAELHQLYPRAIMIGCSTAGEICGASVFDDSVTATAVMFKSTTIEGVIVDFTDGDKSFEVGSKLTSGMKKEGLQHVFVLSDGLRVNGSELVKGMSSHLPAGVNITGGLAGDGARFQETLIIWDGKSRGHSAVAIGFYGKKIHVGYGSLGGWDPFGPERLVTKSEGNILYEMDGRSALALYKEYLGEHAAGLPATGLLFPLSVRFQDGVAPLVRTILGVDENAQSMAFAGDVPEGAYVRLMKANVDRLIDGATEAAKRCSESKVSSPPDLAILISCVGRKLVMKQRVEEEVEAVHAVCGNTSPLTGFYSYGEISPFLLGERCELHNQTMTVTSFKEE